ncbi:S1-C subfamily serine protease [Nakamurella sp. UYEF19]|uniref:trypsin-like peptidase domain-containing protein n=1 Tax=Nakamurella sp. UYEF19 TaxID=1756392 RepID=UPI003397B644
MTHHSIVPTITRGARVRRRLAAVTAATLAGLLLAAPMASADTTVAPSTVSSSPSAAVAASASDGRSTDMPQQEVAALAQSGVVYISVEYRGYVQYQTSSGAKWSGPVKADGACTGFVASSDGYVVTAGHCADPVEGRKDLIEAFLADAVQSGDITSADAQSLEAEAIQNWKVEGGNNGSAVVRELKVEQVGAASGVQVAQAMTANVVDNRPLDQGDVTLLKVESSAPMPVLEVAGSVPDVGSNIAAVGFPGAVNDVVDPNLEPSYKTGRVSANQTFNGNPFTQVDAAFSPGMSGGPVVNMQGQVIGIVSYNPTGTQSFNFAAGQETVSALLTRNGVKAGLTPADQAYRQGLNLFYQQKYREAAAQFDVTLGTEPSHAMAQKYKVKAVALFASEPTTSSSASTTAASSPADSAANPPAPAPVTTTAAANAAAVTTPVAASNSAAGINNASSSSGTSGGIPIWVWIVMAALVLGGGGIVVARGRRSTPVMAAAGGVSYPNNGPSAPFQSYAAAPVDPNATQVVPQATQAYFAPNTGGQGFPVATRQCTQCGNQNALSARFCDNCGAPTGAGNVQPPYQGR